MRLVPRLRGSRRATFVVSVTVVTAVSLVVGVFVAYRQRMEQELTRRNYRVLGHFGEQLSFRIDGVLEATGTLLRSCESSTKPPLDCVKERMVDEIPGLTQRDESSSRLESLAMQGTTTVGMFDVSAFLDGSGDGLALRLVVSATRQGHAASHSAPTAFFSCDLSDALASASVPRLFDAVLLTDANYRVLYRTGTSVIPESGAGELVAMLKHPPEPAPAMPLLASLTSHGPMAQPAAASAMVAPGTMPPAPDATSHRTTTDESGLTTVTAFGELFDVFTSRIDLTTASSAVPLRSAAAGDRVGELRLIGVVRTDSFIDEARVIPPVYAGALMTFVLLLLVTSPLVQLVTLGPFERLRRRQVWLITAGAYAALGLVTFVIAVSAEYVALRKQFDVVSARLGDDVEEQLCERLDDVARSNVSSPALGLRPTELRYPFIVSLVASDGAVTKRWRGVPTPRSEDLKLESLPQLRSLNVADRGYFLDAQADVHVACATDGDVESSDHSVEVIRSRTSGRTTVVVAKRLRGPVRRDEAAVLTIAVPIMSVSDAVLPPGFSYAVVDRNGEALFHSDPRRAKVENLLAETGSASLAAALRFETGAGAPIPADYFGSAALLRVRPLFGLDDWSVVVIEDLAYFRTIFGLMVSRWIVYFTIYSLVVWIALVVLRLIRPGPRSWLWPRSDRGSRYIRCVLILVASLVATAPIPSLYPDAVFVAVVVILPAFVLCVLLLGLRWERGEARPVRVVLALVAAILFLLLWDEGWHGEAFAEGPWQWTPIGLLVAAGLSTPLYRRWCERGTWRYVNAFVALGALSMTLLAAVPALAIFWVARDQVVDAHVRYSQIDIFRRLLDGTEMARRGLQGDWGQPAADRMREMIRNAHIRFLQEHGGSGSVSPVAWLDVFPSGFDKGIEKSDTVLCCCCLAAGGRCDSWCEERGVDSSVCRTTPWLDDSLENTIVSPLRLIGFSGETVNSFQSEVVSALRWIGLNGDDAVQMQMALQSALPPRRYGESLAFDSEQSVSTDWPPLGGSPERTLRQPAQMWVSETWEGTDLCVVDPRWKNLLGWHENEPLGLTTSSQPPALLASLVAALAVLGIAVLFATSGIVHRLFPLLRKKRACREPDGAGSDEPSVYVLIKSGAPNAGAALVLDARHLRRPDGAGDKNAEVVPFGQAIVLHHFEHGLDDPDAERGRLAILEQRVAESEAPIVIVSEVDPVGYYCSHVSQWVRRAEPAADEQEDARNRWARLLSWFSMYRVPIRPDEAGTLFGAEVTALFRQLVAERSEATSALTAWAEWTALTKAERFVLFHLATDGYANHRDAAQLAMLEQRGLIRRTPFLSLASDDLRRFVLEVGAAERLPKWERRAAAGNFQLFRLPILIAMAVVMGLFFVTQKDLVVRAGSALAAFASLVPVAIRLLSETGIEQVARKSLTDGVAKV